MHNFQNCANNLYWQFTSRWRASNCTSTEQISDILTCFAADVLDRAPLVAESTPRGASCRLYGGGEVPYRGIPYRRPIKEKFSALLIKKLPPWSSTLYNAATDTISHQHESQESAKALTNTSVWPIWRGTVYPKKISEECGWNCMISLI